MTLKNVLLINAVSSGATGILLVAMPALFANLFKVNEIIPFVEVGIFLILFSLFVIVAAYQSPIRKGWVKFIIGLDITWVIASAITVVALFSLISTVGSIIILAIAGWVGLMAYLQKRTLQIT